MRRVRYNLAMRHGHPGRGHRGRALALLGSAAAVVVLVQPTVGLSGRAASVPKAIGKGEGQLSLLALPGYAERPWVKPFEQRTGCLVSVQTTSLADELTTLMSGGGTAIDVVSAPGDAALRLVSERDVAPIDVRLVPGWRDFHAAFKNPATTTVDGVHYGIAAQFAPNLLLYDSRKVKRPRSWSVIYSARQRGRITVPDDPMFIADAALYLEAARPSLGIEDPYELTESQLSAVMRLLQSQRDLLQSYWSTASDEIAAFRSGQVALGPGWPYQRALLAKKLPRIRTTVPREGITGWLDSWMVSAKARHPNCAYRWLRYVSTPAVQAQLATFYGATPVNRKACAAMDARQKGSCAAYRANEPESFYRKIRLWQAPLKDCGDARGSTCTAYSDWARAWAELRKRS